MGQHEDCVARQQQHDGPAVIGDVIVHFGQPPDGNPYKGDGGLFGDERMAALLEFHDTGKCDGYTFWYAPCYGGAHIVTRKDVNWATCGVESMREKIRQIRQWGREPLRTKKEVSCQN